MADNVTKRSGKTVKFNSKKIHTAISKANRDVKGSDPTARIMTKQDIDNTVESVIAMFSDKDCIDIEEIQDAVERALMAHGFYEVSKSYILYREQHRIRRDMSMHLMEQCKDLLFTDPNEMDDKRENANINTNAPMGIMLKLGTETSKTYAKYFSMPKEFADMHTEHWAHIHDLDFSQITFNCLQMDFLKLIHGGFNTGHGAIREGGSVRAYASLACVAIQSSQNDMFGGQSINCWDWAMAEGIRKSFKKAVREQIRQWLFFNDKGYGREEMDSLVNRIDFDSCHYSDNTCKSYSQDMIDGPRQILTVLEPWDCTLEEATKIYILACNDVAEETHQAMEAAIHNFNSLHSRAGGQVPFSSINYGMDTSPEGRLAIRETLNAIWNGMGYGETPIFPISVFQLRSGVNYNPEDLNYDLFKYACKVSAKRLFPNFVSLDSSFNSPYYKEGDYNSFVATMGK